MRRIATQSATLALSLALAASLAFAQETPQETAVLDAVTKWKIVNTILFAVVLGWGLYKFAPAFFNARSASIQKAIKDATGLKIEADFRHSEADRKMAALPEAINRLRAEGDAAIEREHERIQQETEEEIEHIHRNVRAEIDALRKESENRVKRETAARAIEAAELRLRERFAQSEPEALIDDFIHLVERGKN